MLFIAHQLGHTFRSPDAPAFVERGARLHARAVHLRMPHQFPLALLALCLLAVR